jgi:hypothetical protein
MEFSDGSHNTNIPNIDSLSGTKYPVSNNDVLKELQTINNNLSILIDNVKEILSLLKENIENKNNKIN